MYMKTDIQIEMSYLETSTSVTMEGLDKLPHVIIF